MVKSFHLHLVSDSTGETVDAVARACLGQFPEARAVEHMWPLIRTPGQLERVIHAIERHPGIVLYTIVDPIIRELLEDGCRRLQVPHIHSLDATIKMMAGYLGEKIRGQSGAHHKMDTEYFQRIEAIHFALSHDDGQSVHNLNQADVILVGVSRTSKTPTCVYLANRGLKAANVPFVPGCRLPPELLEVSRPLVIGLTKDPGTLVSVRRNRLRFLDRGEESDYIDPVAVREEVTAARRFFVRQGWKVIDVTKRSIEETAALILQYHLEIREAQP